MCLISLILLLLCAGEAVSAPRPDSPWNQQSERDHRPACRFRPARSVDEDSLHIYDAISLEASLTIDPAACFVSGEVTYTITPRYSQLDRIDLRLSESLLVDSAWTGSSRTVAVTREGEDSLQLVLSEPLAPGDTLAVSMTYHGNPVPIDSWGGFRCARSNFSQPEIAFSMGDGLNLEPPPANYNWLPTYADPSDKLLWEGRFRVPSNRVVASVGVRLDTVANGDGTTTWHYRLDQPVSTYLLAVSVSDYVIMTQRESEPLIENFVYPNRVSAAEVHFANVPQVLDSFVNWFGPYPFPRMGFAMTRIGDMEHATCVFHIDQVVQANHNYDWLLIHEMSHQWWGNWVTCGNWEDLWLNEGFATYCEALGMEALYGHDAYLNYVVNDLYVTAIQTSENFPIYNPEYYWGQTVYEKGGSVMHMLRALLGDSLFFDAWRAYGQQAAYGAAYTTDWQTILESRYGSSLQWFFNEWVYEGRRYPMYEVHWGPYYPVLLQQVQQTGTLFEMPMDVLIVSHGDTYRTQIWTQAVQSQSFDPFSLFPGLTRVDSLLLDPDHKILKTIRYYGDLIPVDPIAPELPSDFRITSVSPNPFNAFTRIAFELPASSSVSLRIHDISGREVESVNLGEMPAGRHQVTWDGRDAASGVHFMVLQTSRGRLTAKAVLLK